MPIATLLDSERISDIAALYTATLSEVLQRTFFMLVSAVKSMEIPLFTHKNASSVSLKEEFSSG